MELFFNNFAFLKDKGNLNFNYWRLINLEVFYHSKQNFNFYLDDTFKKYEFKSIWS